MNPWEILGLESDVLDKKTIKRAYAAAIREYRPDSHPKEFRERRDAYEELLSIIDFHQKNPELDPGLLIAGYTGHVEEDSVDDGEGAELPDYPETDTERPLGEDAIDAEISALPDGPVAEKRTDLSNIDLNPDVYIPEANAKFLTDDISVAQWQRILNEQSDDDYGVLSSYVGQDEMFKELDANQNVVTAGILEHYLEQGEYKAVQDFCQRWVDQIDRIAYLDAGQFTVYLSGQLAFIDVDVANHMFDLGYGFLSMKSEADWMLLHAERMINAAYDIQGLRPSVRRRLNHCLRTGEWKNEGPEDRELVNVAARFNRESHIYDVCNERLPDLMEASKSQRIAVESRRRKARRQQREQKQESKSGFSWWTLVAIFIVVSNVGRCLNREVKTPDYSQYRTYSTPNYDQDTRKEIQRQLKAYQEKMKKQEEERRQKLAPFPKQPNSPNRHKPQQPGQFPHNQPRGPQLPAQFHTP